MNAGITGELVQFDYLSTNKRPITRENWQAKNRNIWLHLIATISDFPWFIFHVYNKKTFGGAGGPDRKYCIEIFGMLHLHSNNTTLASNLHKISSENDEK
jgi:hypothetical protein